MRNKGRHIDTILNYLKDKLKVGDRYALEKEMNADPFLSDAMDGFSKLSTEELEADLEFLNTQLQLKTHQPKKKRLAIYWSAAASVIVIISIGVLLFNTSDKDLQQLKVAQQVEPLHKSDTLVKDSSQETIIESTFEQEIEVIADTNPIEIASITHNTEKESAPEQRIAMAPMPVSETTMFLTSEDEIEAESTLEKLPLEQNDTYVVTGVVSDGIQAMPGVSISIKGTSEGTISDMDGSYTINAKEGDTLIYAFIGFENKEEKVTRTMLAKADIQLEASEYDLDEVVVIGYGVQKKKEVTGAVARIKSKNIGKNEIIYSDLQHFIDDNKKINANNTITVNLKPIFNKKGKLKTLEFITNHPKEIKREVNRLLNKAPQNLIDKSETITLTL